MILKDTKTYTSPYGRTGTDFVARIDALGFDRFNNGLVTIRVSVYDNAVAQGQHYPSVLSQSFTAPFESLISLSASNPSLHDSLVEDLASGPTDTLLEVYKYHTKVAYLYLHTLEQWSDWQSDEG